MSQLIDIQRASKWASDYLDLEVTKSNISYLIQYGRVKKYQENGHSLIDKQELKEYYKNNHKTKEKSWKKELGTDLNWDLSFDRVPERERTKHVHRLHQYKGKFIPQLVNYFLGQHIDEFKKEVFFRPGDIILDPFVGSGTAMVQANELSIHSIGIDISEFNCLISKCKLQKYDIDKLHIAIKFLINKLEGQRSLSSLNNNSSIKFNADTRIIDFADELYELMVEFNNKHFPNSKYKYKINNSDINEKVYSSDKKNEFLKIYESLLNKYQLAPYKYGRKSFLDKWYMDNIKKEMEFIKSFIIRGKDQTITDLLKIILSRTIRSCRATTHSDLARLKVPQVTPYYCRKHKKICIPLYTLRDKFRRYAYDTLNRIRKFSKIRREVEHAVLINDSRTVDIDSEVQKQNSRLAEILKKNKIRGVFTSPPYVGQIDYHEQHAYAYELFGFPRRDESEIGPLFRGKGEEARKMYIKGISDVLLNIRKYLAPDYDIFLVANDKFNLYPKIANVSGMQIVNRYKRPVLNRTSRDRNPYSEIVFHIKEK